MRVPSEGPDGIAQSVQRLNRKTFAIYAPVDLSQAIEAIGHENRRREARLHI
jgi:hypothetical protein